METVKPLIMSVYDYFNHLNYNNLDLKDRVIYMLFYVTNVAHLRSDMTPSIITQRLDDLKSYFIMNSVERIGLNREPTDYFQVCQIMESNPGVFTVLEDVDKRDRNDRDRAYALKPNIVLELNKELDTIKEYVSSLVDREKDLKTYNEKLKILNHELNKYKRKEVKFFITIDYLVIAFFIILGVFSIFWTSEEWNFIGRWVTKLLSKDNPLRDSIIASLMVNIITSSIMTRRISHNKKKLKLLTDDE